MLRYIRERRHDRIQRSLPFLSDEWGSLWIYLELDGQWVSRQVNVYDSGQILRYDRAHWCDEFGHMLVGRFSLKPKAAGPDAEFITASIFEQQWRAALRSLHWPEQVLRSRERDWGTWEQRTNY